MKKNKFQNKEIPILFEKRDNCCGCTACYAGCPVNAIIMKQDVEGFLYPTINADKCIRCNNCLSVCNFKRIQMEKGY